MAMKDDDKDSARAVRVETNKQRMREVTTEEFLDFCESLLADLGQPIPDSEKAPKVRH